MDEAQRQADDANRSKAEFLGRMSHEFRTPLNSVLGFTNVLLKKMKLEPGSREYHLLQRIRLNGMHLLDLVNDLRVRVDAEGRTVRRILVEDTGVGVPPGRIEMIFLAFEQADGAKARAHAGSGLGLAISRALCELMRMTLSVESVLGKGSTFTISLTPPP